VRLWDAASLCEVAALPGPTGHVETLAFSPDGRMLAVGGTDSEGPGEKGWLLLWELKADGPVVTASFEWEKAVVHAVAFSPDGKEMAAGMSNSVQLWRVKEGQLLARGTLPGDGGRVSSLAFGPGGKTLAVGGGRISHSRARGIWEHKLSRDLFKRESRSER